MQGHVYTIRTIALIDGLLRFVGTDGPASIEHCAQNSPKTVKTGSSVEHPRQRVRQLAQFARDLALLDIGERDLSLTDAGRDYLTCATVDWEVNSQQAGIIRNIIFRNPTANRTVYAISKLLWLASTATRLNPGELMDEFALAIGKAQDWISVATRSEKTLFVMLYLTELELLAKHRGTYVLTLDGTRTVTALGAHGEPELLERVARDIQAFQIEESTAFEGGLRRRYANRYERDPALRAAAIRIHGTTCKGCNFSFEAFYGELGRDFIHVHHLRPISTLGGSTQIDPRHDMTVLCANCHGMVHRYPDRVLTLAELQALVAANRHIHVAFP